MWVYIGYHPNLIHGKAYKPTYVGDNFITIDLVGFSQTQDIDDFIEAGKISKLEKLIYDIQ